MSVKMSARLAIALAAGVAVSSAALVGGSVYFAHAEAEAVERRAAVPRITGTRPADGEGDVSPLAAVAADVFLPTAGSGVRTESLEDGVRLVDVATGEPVAVRLNTTGSGDAVIAQPLEPLTLGGQYRFEIDGLLDEAGAAFDSFTSTFTVAADAALESWPVAFEKVELPAVLEQSAFTALGLGPDGRLYAGTFDGRIFRWPLNGDGTLGEGEQFPTLLMNNGGPRMITGFAFHPDREEPELWVSHGEMAIRPTGEIAGAEDWTGKISVVGGPSLSAYRDVVIGLPRGFKDHLNFQPAFGPDGRLYWTQGSHTSTGSPDNKWGLRPERLLTAAVLALDPAKLPTNGPIDVRTAGVEKPYDPAAADAPVTIVATGVRSGYDVLFHSSGKLFTAVNGAAAGGSTPPIPSIADRPAVPPIDDVETTTDDLLLVIEPGTYHGHPNPVRGELVLTGGNPTADVDPQEIPQYPVGTQPTPGYVPPAFVFGKNLSPNGLLEWASPVFGDELGGAILVTRYSAGDDVQILLTDDAGNITATLTNIVGLRPFIDPLDLVQNPTTGHLYIAEYGGRRITLVRPIQGGESPAVLRTTVVEP
jgi:glucose/arabinose dehydrogenase